MVELDASNAECTILTFKEGLLSKVAHDLKIRVTRFDLTIDPRKPSVKAVFDARSLRVQTAMRDGREAWRTLSEGDKRKIESNIVKDVLHADGYPRVVFESRAIRRESDGYVVEGDLTMHGRTRPLKARLQRDGERLVATVDLNQPDYGIKPYSAMLGTIKIRPRVTVQLSVPGDQVEE